MTVDPAALRDLLDGRWADVRRDARARLGALRGKPVYDLDTEAHREQVLAQTLELAGTEQVGLGFPKRFGGRDDPGASVVSIEMLGFTDLSLMVKAGVQWGLFGGAVQLLGTERHHEAYLPGIMSGELLGCFAMTETGHGSDVQHLRTTATYDAATQEFVVHTPIEAARKEYIGNAARDGRLAVVFAQLVVGEHSYGVHALVVPIRDTGGQPMPGVRIEDCGRKAGLNGVDNGRLWFDQVRVPRDALLDHFAAVDEYGTYSSPIEGDSRRFFTMLGTLVRGRISVAGAAGSAAKTALAVALRYAQVRRQFRAPERGDEVVLLDYRAHQRKLLPALATSYALSFAQEDLVATLHEVQSATGVTDEQAQRELESRAAGIKALTTWHALHTIQACREACGGAGYLSENRLPQLRADIDVFTTFEGDNTVLLQLVAKGLLTGYSEHVHELGTIELARFVTDQFVGSVIERTPLVQRLIDALREDDLHDRGWQLRLFEDREEHVLDTLARRLRRATDGEHDPFEVFNDAQDHVLRAGRVHIEHTVLRAFVTAIDGCQDEETAALLAKVCDLHALSTIENDLAWFLGHNRLTPTRAKEITSAVNGLCRDLRAQVDVLVEAFGIPEGWLDAPIAEGAEAHRQAEQAS